MSSPNTEIHVIGCTVWSDYSADVLFDDGTAMVFGAGLDAFARIRRIHNGGSSSSTGGGDGSQMMPLNFNQYNRLAIDIQQHYTSHALSRDIAHVGAALKVISTVAPRPKFLKVAVKAVDGEEGIVHWKSMSASMEEFAAPPLNAGADTADNIRVGADGSVTVVAVGGNASLWLAANGAFFDVTWPARAFESDGRSIQFVSSTAASPADAETGTAAPGIHNTVKSVLCVPLQQRFPVGLAIDAARKCSPAPSYRNEAIDSHLGAASFWAPLACWGPLLRVAIQTWKDRGGVCPESVVEFLSDYSIKVRKTTSSTTQQQQQQQPSAATTSMETSKISNDTSTILVPNFEAVSCNFPPPIPPKVYPVVSPFPHVSFEDAATLLASTADRLHCLPIHDRVHTAASLCVAWCAGERACWLSPEAGIARALIFEDMSVLHVEGLVPNAPMALLHLLNAVQQQEAEGSSSSTRMKKTVAAAKVYSWESGSLSASARHAPLLPQCVVLPKDFTPCSVPDGVNIMLSRYQTGNSGNVSAAVAAGDSSSQIAAAASYDPQGDPRRGRYLHAEVEFMASLVNVGRSSASRAAQHAPSRSPALGLIATNNTNMLSQQQSGGLNISTATMKQQHQQQQNHYQTNVSSASLLPGENIGAVKCSSVIPSVGTFTAYQDGTVRACFDDRTILSLKQESIEPTASGSSCFSGENIFVTALDSRAISTRFRAAACPPQHPMYSYLQYAMPFLRYSMLPAEERAQLSQDQSSLTNCRSDFSGTRLEGEPNPVQLASQLERVVARSNLALQRHHELSSRRKDLLSKCEFQP